MEKEVLETMAKSQHGSLNFISKDMATLARMLKKTPFEETEKFQANLVQGSFYLTAYTMATKSFNAMIEEKQKNPDCNKKHFEYFMDEILKMQEMEMKKDINEREGEDNDH
jgi:hypothetical protein